MEYMILVGAILVVLVPISYYTMQRLSDGNRVQQADDAVNSLVNAADAVNAIGPGTKQYVWVNIPSGVQSISISENNRLVLKLQVYGGVSDIHATSKATLVESLQGLPEAKGTYKLSVEMLDSGVVQLG